MEAYRASSFLAPFAYLIFNGMGLENGRNGCVRLGKGTSEDCIINVMTKPLLWINASSAESYMGATVLHPQITRNLMYVKKPFQKRKTQNASQKRQALITTSLTQP
jgi:hypothetical protein